MPRLYHRTCDGCGKQYMGRNPKYCSWGCYTESKWVDRECQHCNKPFRARKVYVERGQMKYCSPRCSQIASRSVDGIYHQGERFTKNANGYFSSSRGDGRLLHRVIWEEEYGVIPNGCVIHHKDGDKTNNRIGNLELKEWGDHTAMHHTTGITYGYFTCIGCGVEVKRILSAIKRGQNKYCSKQCAARNRKRDNGKFN